jgi:hypothetical protein
VQELEDLLHDVQQVLLDDATACDVASNQADAKLQQAGLTCPADAALSLAKHMQAAYAAQRLQLPAVRQQQPLHGNNSSSISGDVTPAGGLAAMVLTVLLKSLKVSLFRHANGVFAADPAYQRQLLLLPAASHTPACAC